MDFTFRLRLDPRNFIVFDNLGFYAACRGREVAWTPLDGWIWG